MPEGLLFRGKYVGKTRNTLGYEQNNNNKAVSTDNRSERSKMNS